MSREGSSTVALLDHLDGRERGFKYTVVPHEWSRDLEAPLYRFPDTGPIALWGRLFRGDSVLEANGAALVSRVTPDPEQYPPFRPRRVRLVQGRFHLSSMPLGVYRLEVNVDGQRLQSARIPFSLFFPIRVMDLQVEPVPLIDMDRLLRGDK